MNTSDQKMKTLPTTLLPTWFHDFNVNNMGKFFVLYFWLTNCFFLYSCSTQVPWKEHWRGRFRRQCKFPYKTKVYKTSTDSYLTTFRLNNLDSDALVSSIAILIHSCSQLMEKNTDVDWNIMWYYLSSVLRFCSIYIEPSDEVIVIIFKVILYILHD